MIAGVVSGLKSLNGAFWIEDIIERRVEIRFLIGFLTGGIIGEVS